MAEERITRVEEPTGETHTHTTVITDEPRRSGGSGIVILLVILVLAAIGFWAFSTMGGAEVAKDNAIADAASDVGTAAGQVGDAAQDVADNVAN